MNVEKSKLQKNTQKFRKTKKGVLTNSYSKQRNRRNVYYSLSELHGKFLNDKKFERIYNEWVKSGYNKNKKPVIDRINCKKDYSLDNVQILNFEENRYKQRMELKFLRAKKVYSFLNGKFYKTYNSVSEASKMSGVSQGNISSCLNKKRKSAGGFEWSYENKEGE